jgi:hypothetical protein
MQGRLHAAERDACDGGDLPAAEAFEVGEIDNDPVPVGQCPTRRDHIGVQQAPDHLVFGRAIAASGRKTAMMRVIQPQEFRLPNTSCALAVNACELATAAMP